MGVERVGAALEREGGRTGLVDDLGMRRGRRQTAAADVGGTVEAASREAVEDVGEERGLLEGGVDHARVVPHEDVLSRCLVLVAHGRVECLR